MDLDDEFKKHNKTLEKLGGELSKIQFDFKVKDRPSEKYWVKRIREFDNYHKKTVEYFTEVCSLVRLSNEEQSKMFLLRISKLVQLGRKVLSDMEKIKQNPSAMNLKDKQQSRWSKDLREQLIKSNNECLDHEKGMNVFFKNFYEKNLMK